MFPKIYGSTIACMNGKGGLLVPFLSLSFFLLFWPSFLVEKYIFDFFFSVPLTDYCCFLEVQVRDVQELSSPKFGNIETCCRRNGRESKGWSTTLKVPVVWTITTCTSTAALGCFLYSKHPSIGGCLRKCLKHSWCLFLWRTSMHGLASASRYYVCARRWSTAAIMARGTTLHDEEDEMDRYWLSTNFFLLRLFWLSLFFLRFYWLYPSNNMDLNVNSSKANWSRKSWGFN